MDGPDRAFQFHADSGRRDQRLSGSNSCRSQNWAPGFDNATVLLRRYFREEMVHRALQVASNASKFAAGVQ
jgi:hypothetical protein